VLAYSTVSQLGYMVMACGVAAYSAGLFHLMTHAFFKGLLFLAAGSVIHALGGEQDMRRMGGLRHHIPVTFWTMTAATFAIAGAPLFSGFFSKDEILARSLSSPHGSWAYWAVGVFTALLTSFYMFRLWFLTFFGEFRGTVPAAHGHGNGHIHESPKVMLIPLVILAVGSVAAGWVGVPQSLGGSNHFEHFLAPVFQEPSVVEHAAPAGHEAGPSEIVLSLAATGAGVLGFFLAWLMYFRRPELPARVTGRIRTVYGAMFVKPIVEGSTRLLWLWMDTGLIDGTINQAAESARDVSDGVRRMQSGNLRSYAGWIAAGAALVFAYMIWQGVR
jgi:NADH-quinone oxidoreductase subunit L